MLSLGRLPLYTLLVIVVSGITISTASAFPPDQAASTNQSNQFRQATATPIPQAITGSSPQGRAADRWYTAPNPKTRLKTAMYSHHRTKTTKPSAHRVTKKARTPGLIMPNLNTPPKPKTIETSGIGSLIDLGALMGQMDNLAQFCRNTKKRTALRTAIEKRVLTAMRIAEIDTIARHRISTDTHVATYKPRQSEYIASTQIRTTARTQPLPRQESLPQNQIAAIDDKITQLQQQQERLNRQIAQLNAQRKTLLARADKSGDKITTKANRLIEAAGQANAMLKRSDLSSTERRAIQQRRADIAKQLTELIARSCNMEIGHTAQTVSETSQGLNLFAELRDTIRELKSEVIQTNKEFLRAQQNLTNRFEEIERRTNIIESQIRSRLKQRVKTDSERPNNEHTAMRPDAL